MKIPRFCSNHCLIFLIFVVGPVICDGDNIREARAVELVPKPYQVDKAHRRLMSLDSKARKAICVQKVGNNPVFRLTYNNEAGEVHLYRFDDREELLAMQCPTIPEMYVGLPRDAPLAGNTLPTYWYIRTVVTPTEIHKFKTEYVKGVDDDHSESVAKALEAEKHRFYGMEKETRWGLCKQAEKMIRYQIVPTKYGIPQPLFYSFDYGGWSETYLAIKCATKPTMYIHTGHARVSDVFMITLLRSEVLTGKAKLADSVVQQSSESAYTSAEVTQGSTEPTKQAATPPAPKKKFSFGSLFSRKKKEGQ